MKSQHEDWVRPAGLDPEEAAVRLLRDLRSSSEGLTSAEAARRLVQYGPNQLERRGGRQWPRELARQLTHPLALLLWAAAALLIVVGSDVVAGAVLVIILLNAAFAFVQEMQAERAVEALAEFIPLRATAIRDGRTQEVDAVDLVPGDVVVLEEGDRIAADIRLLAGAIEVDLSALTGESVPSLRAASTLDIDVPLLSARDLVFSGTNCTGGEARGVVFAAGMNTELGRIAALSERVEQESSPLELQVRRVAWLIAVVAVIMAIALIPFAIFAAGLSVVDSVVFAVGIVAGLVPEGLLPVITLALAVAVRALARRGAVVKRLSAVETLGSTDVICTDKTGTLTENRMRPIVAWTIATEIDLSGSGGDGPRTEDPAIRGLAAAASACNNAHLEPGTDPSGDPTEIALLEAARELGAEVGIAGREAGRVWSFHFDPERKLMSTVDHVGADLAIHSKGAPEALLPCCTEIMGTDGEVASLEEDLRAEISAEVDRCARQGLRVLALACRRLPAGAGVPNRREEAESDLCFLGLVAMLDPPRQEVAEAVARCHTAGIRILVITGDHPLTAAAIARRVGIGGPEPVVVTGEEFEGLDDDALDEVLGGSGELVFARASPETKLRIADSLRARGHVVAMTGDGVNDAPALRSADIGVAMGLSGTDVAREASTMILTDDNFATVVVAVRAGRQIYDNVRKFILYIFAHATPEVTPFIVFGLAGGAIPLPLTILQLLAFDVGSETLPALALSREPAEPGLMDRPPRPRNEGVIRRPMLIRAWLFLGLIVAALQMTGFFFVLTSAGWSPGDPVDAGTSLHHAYQQATTMTFFGMIAGQIGTAFAVRTQRAPLRSVGVFSNRFLLLGILGELLLAAFFIYFPPMQSLLGTAALPPRYLLFVLPYPFIVWGADEVRKWRVRRTAPSRS